LSKCYYFTLTIEIVDQNFGFDLKQGILSVKLDPAVEYYYLLVEKVEEKD
jgi:hypothetical protein